MLQNLRLNEIMFLDIETVPAYADFDEMSDSFKKHWEKKSAYFRKDDELPSDVFQRAGIYSEFGKRLQ